VLTAYGCTLAPGLVEIDAGELSAVMCTNGIAHPTGYVLYTWLGFLWSKIPFFPSVIYGLNFFSAIQVALSVNIVLAGILLLLDNSSHTSITSFYKYSIGTICSLSYAFFGLVWSQALSVEVYSFLLLWVSIVFYALVGINYKSNKNKWLYFLGVSLGLLFTHHLLGLFLFPGIFLFLLWYFRNKSFLPFMKVLGMVVACMLISYTYLFLHAQSDPALNWGNPSSITYLVRHITGSQYNSFMFSSESYHNGWIVFWESMPKNVGYVSIPLAFVGLLYGIVLRIKLNAVFIITAFLVLFLIPFYGIRDINNYFLPIYIILPYWMALGLIFLFRYWKQSVLFFFLLPFFLVWSGKDVYDRSKDVYIDQYTQLFFDKMPQDALYIGYAWDILISPTYYCQYCEGKRPDVLVMDKLLMQNPWYYDQLHPALFNGLEKEKEQLLEKLGTQSDDGFMLSRFFTRLIQVNVPRRPVFLSYEIFRNDLGKNMILPPNMMLVPKEFGFEVREGNAYVPMNYHEQPILFNGKDDFYTRLIIEDRVNLYVARCLYELQYGRYDKAYICLSVLQNLYPDHPNTRKLSEKIR